jgi:hypothetical protein
MCFKVGWRKFNASKNSGGHTMARRKRASGKRYGHKRASGMMGGVTGKLMDTALMGAGASLYEKFAEPMLPIQDGMTKALASTGIGLVMASQSNKYVKNAGLGIAVVNAYQIINGFLGNQGGGAGFNGY